MCHGVVATLSQHIVVVIIVVIHFVGPTKTVSLHIETQINDGEKRKLLP